MKNARKILLSIAAICLIPVTVKAAPFEKKEFQFAQPDNTKVKVVATGDEYFQHVESPDGYTLTRNDEGWICYADCSKDKSDLIATDTVYSGEDTNAPENLEKHVEINQKSVDKKIEEKKEENTTEKDKVITESKVTENNSFKPIWPVSGDIKGLTVLVDFPDVESSISKEEIESFFNQKGYTGFSNNGSVRDFFYDISNGKINYTNEVIGYYKAQHPKGYYDTSSRKDGDAAKELIKEIEGWLKNNNINTDNITKDSLGGFKMFNILYAGDADAGWGKGLWPHKYEMRFLDHPQTYEISNIGNEIALGTICHETGHALLNYPDLYRYTNSKGEYKCGPSIVGNFCLMGTGAHNEGGKNPAPPNPYLRYKYSGFIDVKDLNACHEGEKITLNSSNNIDHDVYKWNNESNSHEYYLMENLQLKGRYDGIYDDGIIIWHINEDGFNDFPYGKKYRVSIVQADGKNDIEKEGGSYTGQYLFEFTSKSAVNEWIAPNAKWDDGTYCGLNLSNISNSQDKMTFEVETDNKVGWVNIDYESYYILDNKGHKALGAVLIDGKYYCFNEESGSLVKDCLCEANGSFYLVDDNGVALTGEQTYAGQKMKFNDDGKLESGWYTIDDHKYYYDEKFYVDENGKIAKGVKEIDGKKYLFHKYRGNLETDYYEDGDERYLPDSNGVVQTGWQSVNGENLYFNEDGVNFKTIQKCTLSCYSNESNLSENKNAGEVNKPITLSVDALGGSGNYTYYYSMQKENDEHIESYDSLKDNTFTWIPKNEGIYTIEVYVEDSDGKYVKDSKKIEIKNMH